MSYLLDTNVVNELRKSQHRSDPLVRRWVGSQPSHALFLSVVSVLELEIGVIRVERRDSRQGRSLRRWLEERVLPAFERQILPVDLAVARRAASLHVPDPRPERDALIAATALVHGLKLVTRTASDFEPSGVEVIDPWSG
ncbi:MAG TPA: type II toxin-antitoxin system VapC family toxin [Actinomycetales bacterium]|nr:type II toxin-antitoxin system VapC family toxin [Actinomycetales bacterium]